MADLPVVGADSGQPFVSGTPSLLQAELFATNATQTVYDTATGAWPASNLAIFIPMPLAVPYVAAQVFVMNGGTVSGNIDVGIYTAEGTLVVSKGSTAQAGTTAIQTFNITDTLLNPGLYYLAVAMDNTTGIINHFTQEARLARMLGVLQASSAFALPSTVTFAAMAQAYIPNVSVTGSTVV